MAQKSIKQLRRENAKLKSRARSRESLAVLSKEKALERKRLEAENRALRNPGSSQAKRDFKAAVGKFGGFLKRGALKIHENLERAAAEEERRGRMLAKRKRKKTKGRRRR